MTIIEPEGLNSMAHKEYEQANLAVDSGASETVLSKPTLKHVATKESEAQKRGIRYEVANGEVLEIEGEKTFIGIAKTGAFK